MREPSEDLVRWIIRTHPETIEETIAVADDVAAALGEDNQGLRSTPRSLMGAEIADRGLSDRYAVLLREIRARHGDTGPEIVPAPPYVTTTSRGPVLRLPSDSGRLVIEMAVFAIDPGRQVTYHRRGDEPEEVITVRWYGTGDRSE